MKQIIVAALGFAWATQGLAETREFCLEARWDIGARYQGFRPAAGEWVPTTWCVVTDDDSDRVLFKGSGNANHDYDDSFSVAFLPPDLVRIVNRDAPPDVEFRGAASSEEARRLRRLDPARLYEDHAEATDGIPGLDIDTEAGRVGEIRTLADMPLRGRVAVNWQWRWEDPDRPQARLLIDGEVLLEGTGSWRTLGEDEASAAWQATAGAEPIVAPADAWPSRVHMQLVELADRVYLVRGVRSGFQHMVVDTRDGLVVADAPAGWVELHQLPPADLVPGLGVSGLSEAFVDFLAAELPGRPILAVALTHLHDDHSGGARAFAAAGGDVYAPEELATFFTAALNRESMPADRLSASEGRVEVRPVADSLAIGGRPAPVRLISIGPGPHADAMLGVLAVESGYFFVSDVHVPRSDADEPRPGREATECWFAEWAVANLPDDAIVINSHSSPETPVSRLAAYLESPRC